MSSFENQVTFLIETCKFTPEKAVKNVEERQRKAEESELFYCYYILVLFHN